MIDKKSRAGKLRSRETKTRETETRETETGETEMKENRTIKEHKMTGRGRMPGRNRVIGFLMAILMVPGALWGIPPAPVTAAGSSEDGAGVLTLDDGGDVYLDGSDVTDDSGEICKMEDLKQIIVMRSASYEVTKCHITGEFGNPSLEIQVYNYNSMIVEESGTLTCLSATGKVYNSGTIEATDVNYESGSGTPYTNEGVIRASGSVFLDKGSCSLDNSGEIYTEKMTIGTNSQLTNSGTIEANVLELEKAEGYTSRMTNEGYLKVSAFDSSSYEMGAVRNSGTISADTIHLTNRVYNLTGAAYEVGDYIFLDGFNSEYIGTLVTGPYTKIASTGGTFDLQIGDRLQTAVQAYGDEESPNEAYELMDQLALEEFPTADGTNYLVITGVKNGKYAIDSVTLTPAEGYQIKLASGETEFADSVTLKKGDLYDEEFGGMFNEDMPFWLMNKEDGRYTIANYNDLTLDPCLDEIIFDEDPPEVDVTAEADGKEISLEDGAEITAKELVIELHIVDENPDPVMETDDGNVTLGGTEEVKTATLNYTADPEAAADHYFIIRDLSGNDASIGFRLIYAKDEPEASVSVSDINVGGKVNPVLVTDSDGKKDAKFRYKPYGADDSKYSGTVPTAAGKYTLLVTIPETSLYEAAECTASFTISRIKVAGSVTVADSTVGTEYAPLVSTTSDGKKDVKFEYKSSGAPDGAYNTTKPVYAGDYTVKATIPETDTYEKIVCFDTFTISKNVPETAEIQVADLLVDEKVVPVLTTDSDGKDEAKIYYKPKAAGTSEYTETVPSKAGEYSVLAVIPETKKYKAATCENSFVIGKWECETAKVVVADTTVGTEYAPVLTTDSDGKAEAKFRYKPVEGTWKDYTEDAPTAAGTYTVLAIIPETDTYYGTSCEGTFTISKRTPEAEVTVADIRLGGTPAPEITTDSDGKDRAEFLYRAEGAENFDRDVPVKAGKYVVKAVIPETDTWEAVSCEGTFSILKKEAKVTVTMSDPTAGVAYSPSYSTESDGWKDAKIDYLVKGQTSGGYREDQPRRPGTYVVRVYIPETEDFEAATGSAEYTIRYLETPQTPYEIEGNEKNGFYNGDVNLRAPEGFLISDSPEGTYLPSLLYTEGMGRVYLKRVTDSALTDMIELPKIQIDRELPKLTSVKVQEKDIQIPEGGKVYADVLTIALEDVNLAAVYINGFEGVVEDHLAEILLDAAGGITDYRIVAEDLAGNTYQMNFTLYAAWRESNTLSEGMENVLLEKGVGYQFGEGTWSVKGEDGMVYIGGQGFYVNESQKMTIIHH